MWGPQSVLLLLLLALLSLTQFSGTAALGLSSRLKVHSKVSGIQRLYSSPAESSEASAPVSSAPAEPQSKGFGTKKNPKDSEVVEKDAGTKTYESQSKRGVPEYNVWLRPLNGTEEEWVPVGSMTIPRNVPVANAVFEVEEELLKGTFKLYPKLKAFVSVRGDSKIFQYGYTLKAFPDEPIKPLERPDPNKDKGGNFFSNWLSTITNPIDTSSLSNNAEITIKQ